MKKEWCKNCQAGKCTVSGDNTPSLAQTVEETIKLPPEVRVVTNHNDMLNFWALYGYNKQYNYSLRTGEFPPSITITVAATRIIKSLRCTASNCRSDQRDCSHFR